jgi:hypothetical protein
MHIVASCCTVSFSTCLLKGQASHAVLADRQLDTIVVPIVRIERKWSGVGAPDYVIPDKSIKES